VRLQISQNEKYRKFKYLVNRGSRSEREEEGQNEIKILGKVLI
jgi:hypothetical protein